MPHLDPHLLGPLIRWLHVAAMAGLLGGAILVWAIARSPRSPGAVGPDDPLLVAARAYEWLFWAALGALVMTGVGNLGAFGPALPGRETAWGGALAVKLAAVGAFTLVSLVRTLLVAGLGAARPAALSAAHRRLLRGGYAGTALAAAAVLAVAVSLAHGGGAR
jgi:uncharacterized membrane protein